MAGDTYQYISQDARTMPQTARGRSDGPFTACQYGCVSADTDRSLTRIEVADLLRLAALAADAEAELFGRNSNGSGRYAGRLLGRALCQGAALHYLNGENGVKDFDVWSFYAQYDDWPFPARWRGTRDFGPSKFGRYPGDPRRYSGRRVDLLGRSLPASPAPTLQMSFDATLPLGGPTQRRLWRPRQ